MLHDLESVLRASKGHAINAEALKKMGYPEVSLEGLTVKVKGLPSRFMLTQ